MAIRKRDHRLSLDQAKRISRARVLSHSHGLGVQFSDATMVKLINFIAFDVNKLCQLDLIPDALKIYQDYYDVESAWFDEKIEVDDFVGIYLESSMKIPEFETAFECMCEIHKRRTKFEKIQSSQKMTNIDHITPRALLEYGQIPNKALGAYLVLRKFFYGIDNRSAQETGYLFEPILANSLGGEPYSAKASPVTRFGDGEQGRQIDCIVENVAFEFKLRITEAASGRGRFNDELQLPQDCMESGYIPILIVLDDTSDDDARAKSAKLAQAYIKAGGMAYCGDEAWDYIRSEAGPTMSIFIDKYVRQPLERVSGDFSQIEAFSMEFDAEDINLSIKVEGEEDSHGWTIARPA